ncbi:UDP-glucoronosyl and UDP-glucosyl transferase domain-containing protein [Ditylenchus destructor]|nr:UDP-glucoronosyl and UDP-glucosyl transferase domain-containing protein [Ditylenchus destructor]
MKYFSLCLFLDLLSSSNGLNILLFLIGTNQYERSIFEYLAQQLALRHHDVTTVKPILIPEEPRLVQPRLHLVKEKLLKDLLPKKLSQPLEQIGSDVPWRKEYELDAFNHPYWTAHNYSCEKMLNSNLMEVISKDQIDVAIVYAGNPCQVAIVHALNIPFIYFDLEGLTDETIIASGIKWNFGTSSASFIAHFMRKLSREFHLFLEALAQSGTEMIAEYVSARYRLMDGPINRLFSQDYEIRRKFKNGFPDVNWIKRNAEAYFLNTDMLLEEPTLSLPPNVVPVGGIHLDPPRPLFSPWNTSIAEAKNGIILVSMGTQVNSNGMPPEMVKGMLNAFAKLTDYRIFWKIGPKLKLPGIDDVESVPANINITTFFPQNELLSNRRTRLLITNGGMASIMEAMAHGVPILGIPLYGSNHKNLANVQRKGMGLVLEKSQVNERTLLHKMKLILDSSRYATVAKDMSKEFRSRPSTPFESALHWIEHMLKLSRNEKCKIAILFLEVGVILSQLITCRRYLAK